MREQKDNMVDGLVTMARERAGCAFRDFKAAPVGLHPALAHLLSIKKLLIRLRISHWRRSIATTLNIPVALDHTTCHTILVLIRK